MSIVARVAFVLAGILPPVLAVELGLRLFGAFLPGNYTLGQPLTYHPTYGSFHTPNTSGWFRNAEFTTRYQYNAKGLSGPDVDYAKPPGTQRILVLGDSFVEGNEVAVGGRMTDLIQARFDADLAPGQVEVINGGVSGWSNAQELLYFEDEGYRFSPDLVVMLAYLHNDVPDNTPTRDSEIGTRTKPYFAFQDGRLVELPFEVHTDSWREIVDRSARQLLLSYDLLQNGVLRKPGQTVRLGFERTLPRIYLIDEPTDLKMAWDVTEALLVRLRDDVAARGGRLVVVGVPSKWQVYPRDWRDVLAFFHAPSARSDLQLPNAKLDEIGRRNDIPTLDLLPVFRVQADSTTERLYYQIDAHWTAAGHRLAAAALYVSFLAALGR